VWGDGDIRSLPIAGCKIEALRDAGITSIDQLPGLIALRERFHLTKKECKFALGAKEKGVQIEPELAAELGALRYPLYFMGKYCPSLLSPWLLSSARKTVLSAKSWCTKPPAKHGPRMDFETVFPALPFFAGLRPYDQLP
jgi:hypothetical protein